MAESMSYKCGFSEVIVRGAGRVVPVVLQRSLDPALTTTT
jgi:hypothetical protein